MSKSLRGWVHERGWLTDKGPPGADENSEDYYYIGATCAAIAWICLPTDGKRYYDIDPHNTDTWDGWIELPEELSFDEAKKYVEALLRLRGAP